MDAKYVGMHVLRGLGASPLQPEVKFDKSSSRELS